MIAIRSVLGMATFASIVACTRPARAYRPFDGTDADVAALGDFELELGPVHYLAEGPSKYLLAPATVLNLGFAPGWEAVVDFTNVVGLQAVPGQSRDRLLDTDALVKAVLVEGSLQDAGQGPSVAVEFGPLLPDAGDEEGFGASCDVIVSKRWTSLTVHANNWFELTRGNLHFDWFEGVIVERPFEGPARPVMELFVEHEFVADVTTYSGLLGGIWRAAGGLDLDAGVREARVQGSAIAAESALGGTAGSVAGREPASAPGLWATEVRLGLTWTLGVH